MPSFICKLIVLYLKKKHVLLLMKTLLKGGFHLNLKVAETDG